MAPPKAWDPSISIKRQLKAISTSIRKHLNAIQSNWHLQYVGNCLPPEIWPNERFDLWGEDIITLLSQISSMPAATLPDFIKRLRKAIKARQEKNSSRVGRQGWTKAVDLRAVLKEYEREAEETRAEEARSAPKANRRNGDRTTRATRTQVPKTPVNHEDEDEDEEEEGSSEPLPGGKYQYLNGVRPVKVNLNPTASAAKKPTRPKAPPRGKRRKADEEEMPDPQAAELPSLVYQDPDPRVPDDTGFLSDLEGDGVGEKGRKRKRLSRLQQQRVREPHWQRDLDNIVVDVPGLAQHLLGIPTVEDAEEAAALDVDDVAMDNAEDLDMHNGQDILMDDGENAETEVKNLLENLPKIPASATVRERREMEELRLSMEQRIWRIKVLRIKERMVTEELARREDNYVDVGNNVSRKGRVLRTRRGR